MRIESILNWTARAFVIFIFTFMFINITALLISEKINLFAIDSPLIFAFLVALMIFTCFIITAYKEFMAFRASSKTADLHPTEDASKEMFREIKSVLLYVLGVYLYIITVRYLRFTVGSIVFMAIAMLMLNSNSEKIMIKAGKAFGAAAATVPVLYYVFHGIFNVMLP